MKLLRLSQHNSGLKIILQALWAGSSELLLLLLFAGLGVIIFAAFLYFAEKLESEVTQFTSIPIGLWWGFITMTTVGFGDIVPITGLGKVIGKPELAILLLFYM